MNLLMQKNINFLKPVAGILIAALGTFLLWTCASQGGPPGGPEDKTPPHITSVFPENGSTNVSKKVKIKVEFSEYLTQRSIEPSIFISPYIEGGFEVNPDWTSLEIDFNEPLDDSTTYIVTIGTGLSDLHGNPLAETYHLAFSTGSKIEQGQMAGQLYPNNLPKGAPKVLAYIQSSDPVDSLLQRRPDYVTYPDSSGMFSFANMVPGQYLFLALQDQNGNYIYDPGEWTGIPTKIYWPVSDSVDTDALQMQMFQYPADSLVLSKVDQQNEHLMTIGLNRPPAQKDLKNHFILVDSEQDTSRPDAISYGDADGEYLLEFYNTVPDSSYTMIAQNFTDQFGLPFGYNRDRRDITISANADTLPLNPPQISLKDSTKSVKQNGEFRIIFPRAIEQLSVDSLFKFSGVDPDTFTIGWLDPRTILVQPDSLWPASEWMSWTLFDSLVQDYRDSTYSDTVSSGAFEIESGEEYGSIAGSATVNDQWDTKSIIIEADLVSGNDKSASKKYFAHIENTGNFRFPRLPAGKYRLQAFYDADGSGDYTFGRPVPFVPAEKFVIFQNEVDVRARWETSGILARFPE